VREGLGDGGGRVTDEPQLLDATSSEPFALYQAMLRVRAFEVVAEHLVRGSRISGNLHLSIGQEAVAVGVCGALRGDDHIVTTHRGHGHCLAKGGQPERMFAELFGHVDGYCKGRAGSMHIADPDSGILGATAIVGGSFGMALGAALSSQVLGLDRVAVAFFGEGAAAEGSLHEALNLAALWCLPVIFCCENNQYAELSHVSLHLRGSVHGYAGAHGMPGVLVDGNDVLAVRAAAAEAVQRARAGRGPSLLECETYRHSGHYVGDPERYREQAELEAWRGRDPIMRMREHLSASGQSAERLDAIEQEIRATMHETAERAARGAPAEPALLLQDVYAS
jgi:TPP-dependent pyruvate/acetoin dehydrogenase alpha subunit